MVKMTENYKLRCALRHDDDEVRGIAICGNTGKIVTSSDKSIRLWTVQGEHLWKHTYPSPVQCISWIPSNPTLQSGGVSVCMKNVVLVWDLDSRKMVKSLVGHESQVTGIVVDGDDLVSSSIDGTLKRWRNWECMETWAAHEGPIQAVVKLPTGELVTGSSRILESRDSILKMWKGKICLHTFHGHTDTVCGLAAMSDRGILSASHDGSLRFWALNGQETKNMYGHTATVCSVDSLASGLIVSGSEDRSAKIWKGFSCVQSLEHPRCVRDTKFMENGDIVTACSDGLVRIWTVDTNMGDTPDLLVQRFNATIKEKEKVAEKPKVECVVNTDPMRFRPSRNMVDTTNLLVQRFNATIKEKEKVAEKPKVECVVNTDPMRFRPSRNMVDTTNLLVQRFNATIKEKEIRPSRNMVDTTDLLVQRFDATIEEIEKVAEKRKVECVVNTDPMRFRPSRNMVDTTDLLVQRFNATIKEKEKVAEKPKVECVVNTDPMRLVAVDIGGGRTLQYNRSVNVYAAAGRWLIENSEPFQHLLTIKDTILEATGQKDNIFVAPISHKTSYIPPHFKYLPEEKLLTDSEITTMKSIYGRLESPYDNDPVFQASDIDLLLGMLSSWPPSRISHVIDITRMTVLYHSGANLLMGKIYPCKCPDNDVLMKVIKSNSQTKENLLANIRAVTNLFRSSWCFGWLQAHRIEILSSFSSWHLLGVHDAYSVLILNYAVLLIPSSPSHDGLYHILFAALEILRKNVSFDSKFNALRAVGSMLLLKKGLLENIGRDFVWSIILKASEGCSDSEFHKLQSEIKEVLGI
ncbi:ubiquitin homeostasis protein lub1 isoform X5 [Medicago truncatula]|uniref:ubiquitin homeostasis protein lub1 isoform X5 n=1 Tax=Medicago truncatula TaxID=3880 RepID=UPI00196749C0|nr:ubiquitin homeostasis protein lub1-like isoform X5 [Medicago truncatula]